MPRGAAHGMPNVWRARASGPVTAGGEPSGCRRRPLRSIDPNPTPATGKGRRQGSTITLRIFGLRPKRRSRDRPPHRRSRPRPHPELHTAPGSLEPSPVRHASSDVRFAPIFAHEASLPALSGPGLRQSGVGMFRHFLALGCVVVIGLPVMVPSAGVAADAECQREVVLGKSRLGSPIVACQLRGSDPAVKRPLLVVGSMHGTETAGMDVVSRVDAARCDRLGRQRLGGSYREPGWRRGG